jgi:4-hydroxy-3-methylbut-2-en-1-yl diphosphate reductase
MERAWFEGVQTIGLTAGASAPEVLIQQVISRLREWGGAIPLELDGRPEHMVFSMPKELRIPTRSV